jgi:hypothetical protein
MPSAALCRSRALSKSSGTRSVRVLMYYNVLHHRLDRNLARSTRPVALFWINSMPETCRSRMMRWVIPDHLLCCGPCSRSDKAVIIGRTVPILRSNYTTTLFATRALSSGRSQMECECASGGRPVRPRPADSQDAYSSPERVCGHEAVSVRRNAYVRQRTDIKCRHGHAHYWSGSVDCTGSGTLLPRGP